MSQYRYTLQPYGNGKGTRFTCPNCHKKKQFTRYINTETGEYLAPMVGSCNRKAQCGYHYTPKDYFADNPENGCEPQTASTHYRVCCSQKINSLNLPEQRFGQSPKDRPDQQPSFIPIEKFRGSRRFYEANNLVYFFRSRFGNEVTEKLIALYHIGTSKKWPGATIFWQIDQQARIRTGKIMLYNAETGKRVKKPYDHIFWAHRALGQAEFNLKQCLFGEHLLRQFPDKPVAIVESEKTAIICSVFLPKYIWLAAGGLSFLTEDRCVVLKYRNVTLFPDLGGYERWSQKAKELNYAQFTVSDILERMADDEQKKSGLDLADFL